VNFLSEYFVTYFSQSGWQLLGTLSVLGVCFGLAVIGAAVGGRDRYRPADLICGWAVIVTVFTLVGIVTPLPFTYLAIAFLCLAIASAVYVWRRDGQLIPLMAVKILVLTGPLLFLLSAMTPSQWDEYSHWLLAARYLVDFDGFPGPGMPVAMMDFPGYPYGSPLITYLVSQAAGHFVENTGAVFHVALLVSMALVVIDLICKGAKIEKTQSWGLAALGFMSVTLFSTTFVQKVVFTAYADLPTSIGLAFVGILGWMIVEKLAAGDDAKAKIYALQLGLVLAVFINIKPANVTLVAFAMAGICIAILRDPNRPVIGFLKLLPRILTAAIVIFVGWKLYAAIHLPYGSMSIRSYDQWYFSYLPETLSTILGIMARKGAYFTMMIALSLLGLAALFKYRGAFGQLAVIVAVCFVGYNLFLVFSYIAIFGPGSGPKALSYWRYNQHLGHLGAACAAYGVALLWHRYLAGKSAPVWPKLGWAAMIIVIAAPLAFAPKVRFDVRAPKQFVKQVGLEMRSLMQEGSRVFVIDPLSAGFYAKLMRYQLYGVATYAGEIKVTSNITAEGLRDHIVAAEPTHLWVHTQNDAIVAGLEIDLKPQNAHLLEKQGADWQLVKSWPYPGYNQPQDIPD